jgi:protein-disulfide isomerase
MKRSAVVILSLLVLTACGPKAGTQPGVAKATPAKPKAPAKKKAPEKPAVPLTTEGVFQAVHDGLVQALEISCACQDLACLDGPETYRKNIAGAYERLDPYYKKSRQWDVATSSYPPEKKLWKAYQAQVKGFRARHSTCETALKKQRVAQIVKKSAEALAQENSAKAIEIALTAVKDFSRFPAGWAALGRAQVKAGKPYEAIKSYDKATIKKGSEQREVWQEAATLYESLGRELDAAKTYESYMRLAKKLGRKEDVEIAEKLRVWGPKLCLNPLTRPPGPDSDKVYAYPISKGQVLVAGDEKALVTIVKIANFEDDFSRRVRPTLDRILKEYKGQIRIFYHQRPLPSFQLKSTAAAAAAACAGKQGKFKMMHDRLYAEKDITQGALKNYAKDLGLNLTQFDDCFANAIKGHNAISSDLETSGEIPEQFSSRGVPSFFINGRSLRGALPFDHFKKLIDVELAKAKKSGMNGQEYYDKVVLAKGSPGDCFTPEEREKRAKLRKQRIQEQQKKRKERKKRKKRKK